MKSGYLGQSKIQFVAISISSLIFSMLVGEVAHAVTTRDEVYRSDKLRSVVYRDSTSKEIFWYLPPIKLYEENGNVIYYKRQKNGKTDYYFYVVAYMNDELVNFLAGEIPGITQRSQFKPVIVKRFGIKVSQFESVAMSDEITDYQYLNAPHLVKFSLSTPADAEEFEFFLKNKPGIQANVIFEFIAERQDKYLTIELTHREVYDALGIKASGRYTFVRGQIEAAISRYLSNKQLNIKGKGDLPIPDIVNKVIAECFVPVTRRNGNGYGSGGYNGGGYGGGYGGGGYPCAYDDYDCDGYPDYGGNQNYPRGGNNRGGNNNGGQVPPKVGGGNGGFVYELRGLEGADEKTKLLERNRRLMMSALSMPEILPGEPGGYDNGGGDPTIPGGGGGTPPTTPGSGNGGSPSNGNAELAFEFKKELATSNQTFLYQDIRYSDATEITSVPVYLSVMPGAATNHQPSVTQIAKRDFVVEYSNSAGRPFRTGINVKPNEQYIITAIFALSAKSSYMNYEKTFYDPRVADSSVTANLYYRVGDGPWTPVDREKVIDGRAVIKAEGIYKGELQFSLDRNAIWGKIDPKFTESALYGLVDSIFTYNLTYPQFNVVVTGRRYSEKQ